MRKALCPLLLLLSYICFGQTLRELYQDGLKAYEEKDYEAFKQRMLTIDSMRPNYPSVVYNLAAADALLGNKQNSIEILNKYILMDASQNFGEDKDFSSLVELTGFVDLQNAQLALNAVILPSDSYQMDLLSSHPESIAYSDKQKAIYIGGVRDGAIWKVLDGKAELWAESTKNSWSVMGLQVSTDEKVLWVCTSSMPNYAGFEHNEEGLASVLKYDLKRGKLLETFALPGGHNFGDLIVDNKDNVYISDGISNKLYWISAESNELEEFADLSSLTFNLQGLTFDDNQKNIYLSDYIDGIYKLNIETKHATKLSIEKANILIKGIDGLYFEDKSLIGLHNGTKPNRVVKYKLSDDQTRIINKEILIQGGDLGEPTQGAWVDGSFHFIMNSPWGSYDQDGRFKPKGDSVIIGVLNLSNY